MFYFECRTPQRVALSSPVKILTNPIKLAMFYGYGRSSLLPGLTSTFCAEMTAQIKPQLSNFSFKKELNKCNQTWSTGQKHCMCIIIPLNIQCFLHTFVSSWNLFSSWKNNFLVMFSLSWHIKEAQRSHHFCVPSNLPFHSGQAINSCYKEKCKNQCVLSPSL